MSNEKNLAKELSQVRALLSNATDTLEHERRLAASAKNKVPGGYYMMSRAAEKNLRGLQKEHPAASLVFSVIRENMQIGTSAVTISNTALAAIIGRSRATITRAIKHLSDHCYVQIVKTGNVNTYVVNERIAFAGNRGQRSAVFSATVVAHESEQEEGWDSVRKLKTVPIIYEQERVLLSDERLPPPDQTDLNLD